VIRWLVFSVLLVGGAAIVVAGRRRARATSAPVDGRSGATRATVAGAVVAALGVLVAAGAPEATISLAFLAGGAVVATAGIAPVRGRGPDRTADRAR
jgi:hypothetical protein